MSKAPTAALVALRNVDTLLPDPNNARTHSPEQIAQIAASMMEFGFTNPMLASADNIVRAGNGRLAALMLLRHEGRWPALPNGTPLPPGKAPVIDCTGWTAAQRRAYALADNQLALNSGWDDDVLRAEIAALAAEQYDLPVIGFDADELARLLGDPEPEEKPEQKALGALAAQFMIPPFSVLNAREGWWQDRKRTWLALGIQSELGRGADMAFQSQDSLTKLQRGGGAAPGGSPRAACDYSKRQRGNGKGQPLNG